MVSAVDEPRPSAAEVLLAEYGDEWDIFRKVLPGGGHGDWVAERLAAGDPDKLTASTVDELAEQLREATS